MAAIHGNKCNLRERAKMSAARESFIAFVGVFHFVTEEEKTLVGGESMLLASFH